MPIRKMIAISSENTTLSPFLSLSPIQNITKSH
nr:MAG TPA: hypothetical protein [Inoviridae sp.]